MLLNEHVWNVPATIMRLLILVSATIFVIVDSAISSTKISERHPTTVKPISDSKGNPPSEKPPQPTFPPPRADDSWKALIYQANTVEQCPCVVHPRTNKCAVYDPTVQAATFVEAILNFEDLTLDSSKLGTPWKALEGNDFRCETDECRACVGQFIYHMQQHGNLDKKLFSSITITLKMPSGSSITPELLIAQCNRYSFSKYYVRPNSHGNSMLISSNRNGSITTRNGSVAHHLSRRLSTLGRSNVEHQTLAPKSRTRRDAVEDKDLIGKRRIINCIGRGEPSEVNSDSLSLCGYCWAIRELPEAYFPMFMNELVCDSDVQCLSGWGECKQKYRSFNVLKNIGNETHPAWQATTITAGNCCDCQVQTGSPLEFLVKGKGA